MSRTLSMDGCSAVCLLSTQWGISLTSFTFLSYCSLNACYLTAKCCDRLANSITSSKVRELDLSNNNLTDAGLKQLSTGLKNSKLQTFRSKLIVFCYVKLFNSYKYNLVSVLTFSFLFYFIFCLFCLD